MLQISLKVKLLLKSSVNLNFINFCFAVIFCVVTVYQLTNEKSHKYKILCYVIMSYFCHEVTYNSFFIAYTYSNK